MNNFLNKKLNRNKMSEELGYLCLVRKVLLSGRWSENRTGVKTLSLFGDQLRYSLRGNRLAMLTTKFISFSSVAEELLWFIRGDTNQKTLADRKVNIWRGNSSRQYLDSRKLFHYKEYESLGPIYGFQWRHFGANYIDCHTDYSNMGVDQLKECINQIQNDPHSRRIIMSAWNPVDLNKMALPPCHILVQFEVNTENRELSAHMYQRSADLMLGVPYNLTSYSLLIHMLAHVCHLTPGELICSYGNLHIYENHIENAKKQIEREPLSQPKLKINAKDNQPIEMFSIDNFEILNYKYYDKIRYEMVV